jgi:hypothetical protein
VLHSRPRDIKQVLRGSLHRVGGRRATLPCRFHDLLHLALGTARAIPQDMVRQGRNDLEAPFGFGQCPAEHPHAIGEQRTGGGVLAMDFHDRPSDTQRAC